MIRFSVSTTEKQYTGFTCEGHAGWADEGEDIVCAAVSVLTLNTINSIESFTDDAFEAEEGPDGGYLRFHFTETPSEAGLLLMKSLVLGISQVQQECEDFIQIEFVEES